MKKFPVGQIVATPGALDFMREQQIQPSELLRRHVSGDWGDLVDEDKAANEQALEQGGRLLSGYKVGGGKVWVITEWDRSVTTLLLPEEY